jgi:hypothetical protein
MLLLIILLSHLRLLNHSLHLIPRKQHRIQLNQLYRPQSLAFVLTQRHRYNLFNFYQRL